MPLAFIIFIITGFVFLGTIGICILMLFAAGMSDSTDNQVPLGSTFTIGTILSLIILASHWAQFHW
jgi:hypothetical protein